MITVFDASRNMVGLYFFIILYDEMNSEENVTTLARLIDPFVM